MNVIVTTGLATRMGSAAPDGCKALFQHEGRPAIEHQLDVLGEAHILCRSRHAGMLEKYGTVVVDDSLAGPAGVLLSALAEPVDGPVTVLYADTLLDELPSGDSWCAVATTTEAREWDLVGGGFVYRGVARPEGSLACVGAYRFADAWKLSQTVAWLAPRFQQVGTAPLGMGAVVNQLRPPFVEVPSWRNLG